MLLCLGPSGAGKTTLIKKLTENVSFLEKLLLTTENETVNELPAVVPTMGTNIASINLGENKKVEIHEVGGAMAPIWNSHFRECTSLIYVIDAGNLQQISCAFALLVSCLEEPSLNQVPFLIVLNKVDVFGRTIMATNLNEIKSYLQLDSIMKYSKQNITLMEVSCLTGSGLSGVFHWLRKNYT